MAEERLLERIAAWKHEPERRAHEDAGRMLHSVTNHLQMILNTWQGNVLIADDYGIPDLNILHSSDRGSVQEIETAIRKTVSNYEPRLDKVRVVFVPGELDDMRLIFRITAELVLSNSRAKVNLETIVDSDGKIDVRT
jgi:type VI secretion system protein